MAIRRALWINARPIEISQRSATVKSATGTSSGKVDAQPLEGGFDLPAGGTPVEQARALRLGQTEQQVLQGIELGDEVELLMDEAETQAGAPLGDWRS